MTTLPRERVSLDVDAAHDCTRAAVRAAGLPLALPARLNARVCSSPRVSRMRRVDVEVRSVGASRAARKDTRWKGPRKRSLLAAGRRYKKRIAKGREQTERIDAVETRVRRDEDERDSLSHVAYHLGGIRG